MPTQAGLPMPSAMLPGGPLNPVDWIDLGSPNTIDGADQTAFMRGHPEALSWWQRRQIKGPETIAQGWPIYLQSRPYDRGAGAFSPKFGSISYNPIGAGIYAAYKLPVIAGPAARYQFGAIFFDVQAVPTSVHMSPSMSSESLAALLAISHVGPSYATTG
jgi:hypothetical protein